MGDKHVHKRVFIVQNLGCANCAAKMERKILELPQVESAALTFATKQLQIETAAEEDLLPVIQEICASVEHQVVVVRKEDLDREKKAMSQKDSHMKEFVEIGLGVLLFAAALVMESQNDLVSFISALAGYIVLGRSVVLTALKNLTKGHVFDENFLMSAATIGAFLIKDFPEAVGVMLFYRVGELFEDIAVEKSRNQIMEAVDLRQEVVNKVHGNHSHVIPAKEAKVGDVLLVRPGDRIPLDGRIIDGVSRIDTSPVTGEPVPVGVKAGDEVISGCVNTSGLLKIRVEKELKDSMVTRILDSVENAAANKPKMDRFITRFSRIYTPVVVTLALATAILPSLITGEWNHWIYTAITFLVISCPCALVLSVPLAFFSGIGAGSKRGVLFKGGTVLESLWGVRAVVMDKTGTVTQGDFVVQEIRLPEEGIFSEQEILKLAASGEMNSTHPIAVSILQAAKERGASMMRPKSMEEIAGHGIKATIAGKQVLCGNRKLLEQEQILVPDLENVYAQTLVYVAIDSVYAGCILIADTIKSNAKDAVDELKKRRIVTAMLTGDAQNSAEAVAKETGIENVYARLLPEEKLEYLQKIRESYGNVMFVGDGINDAPVLAGADVGAAMGNGADAAIEAADVVFMTSDMNAIVQSIDIANLTCRIAKQNVIFALTIKFAIMILGVLGFANMWLAVFADTGVAMLCILNSIRILYTKH